MTPPLDGRLSRVQCGRVCSPRPRPVGFGASEQPITLERMAVADGVLLSSAISGVRPAAFTCRRPSRVETGAQLRDVLREPVVVEAR